MVSELRISGASGVSAGNGGTVREAVVQVHVLASTSAMKTLAALLREIDEIRKFVLLDLSIPVLVYLDALRHAHQSGGGAMHSAGLHD